MLFFGKRKADETPTQPQQMEMKWDSSREHQEAMLNSSLFEVAARLTEVRHPNGGESEEAIVSSFTKTYDLLHDWFRGAPIKEELRKALDKLYPVPAGYKPGESLVGTEKHMINPWHPME